MILELGRFEGELRSLKKILGDLYDVAIQKKTIRAGIGKLRGRKYKHNAGLLLVIGKDEEKKIGFVPYTRPRRMLKMWIAKQRNAKSDRSNNKIIT